MASVADIGSEHGVNDRKSILLKGILDDDTDEDIVEAVSLYGSVGKIVRLKDFQVIVEFDSEESLKLISFPSVIQSPKNPVSKWCLDRVEVLTTPTQSQSAIDENPEATCSFKTVQNERGSSDSTGSESDSSGSSVIFSPQKSQPPPSKPLKSVSKSQGGTEKLKRTRKGQAVRPKEQAKGTATTLDSDILNPPDVQRIIVEHVIKSEATTAPGSKRLRSFSGRVPKPPGEVDFETWCLHVELMFQDGYTMDVQRRLILESLLSPAADIVKQLGSQSPPQDYVKLLQSAYGLVDDGEEIFARFLSTHQDAGEKASEYIQRLQTLLSTAIRRGGVSEANANRQLYKQFVRGCWDQTLLLTLQQKLRNDPAPKFSELLLELRTEEERRSLKVDRMQRHLGGFKAKPLAQFHGIPDPTPTTNQDTDLMQKYISETENLRKQVAELKLQLTEKRAQRRKKHEQKHASASEPQPPHFTELQAHQPVHRSAPKAWFCFKCGENNHIARECINAPNKDLVDKKNKELKTKQQEWQAKYAPALNWTGFQ